MDEVNLALARNTWLELAVRIASLRSHPQPFETTANHIIGEAMMLEAYALSKPEIVRGETANG